MSTNLAKMLLIFVEIERRKRFPKLTLISWINAEIYSESTKTIFLSAILLSVSFSIRSLGEKETQHIRV